MLHETGCFVERVGYEMSEFLTAFFPGFVATVFGVALGVPVAFYVNQRVTKYQRRHEEVVENKKRHDIANVIRLSLFYNERVLGRIAELCMEGKAMRDPDLQLATWQTVGHSFCQICDEPDLLQLLSHHWLRLNNLATLNREIFDRNVGDFKDFRDDELRALMWGNLYEFSNDLKFHSLDLAARVEKYNID